MGPKLVHMHTEGEPTPPLSIEHGYMLDQNTSALLPQQCPYCLLLETYDPTVGKNQVVIANPIS